MKKIKLIISSFYNYVFNKWLMSIPFHFFRVFFISKKLKSVGNKSSFLMYLEIRNGQNITVGNYCVINQNVILDGRGGKLEICNNVDIGQETNIWTLEHDVNDSMHKSIGSDVIIEDNVWIASRCTILPGVRIGKGAIVASNSVVTKNVEDYTIVAGIPARPIGKRVEKLNYCLHHRPWFE
jgi:acetyltransferase-like isoleucine patch superfamily enzyme